MADSKNRRSRIIHYLTQSEVRKIKGLCVYPAKEWSNDEVEKKQRNNLHIFIMKKAFRWKIKSENNNFITFILQVRRRAFRLSRYKKRILPSLPKVEDLFSIFHV